MPCTPQVPKLILSTFRKKGRSSPQPCWLSAPEYLGFLGTREGTPPLSAFRKMKEAGGTQSQEASADSLVAGRGTWSTGREGPQAMSDPQQQCWGWNRVCWPLGGSPVTAWVKNPPAIQETQETRVWSLDQQEPLEKEMKTNSSILG